MRAVIPTYDGAFKLPGKPGRGARWVIGQEADRQTDRQAGRQVSNVVHGKSTLAFDHNSIVLRWFLFSGWGIVYQQ